MHASVDITVDDTPNPKRCHVCASPGVRNIGSQGYCTTHLDALYATFDPGVFADAGIGRQDGPLRSDWGPGYADVRCNACSATWVGLVGEPCGWCERSRQIQLEHQAELVLTEPDIGHDDARRQPALIAWADRLWVAVQAGIIDQQSAERALRRAKEQHGAAA